MGDRAGEATTRYNIATVQHAHGDLEQAICELEHVVDLDRQVQPPDLADDTAVLEQLRRQQAEG